MNNKVETMKKKSKHTLTPRLRFPEFRDKPGWEPTPLSALLDYEQPGKYIVQDSNYQDTGTPVLTANKSFVLGHTAEITDAFEDVPVIIFDDFTTDKKYVDFPFKVKSSAIKILRSRGKDELKLIYELMSRIRFDPAQHKRYYISEYQNLEIALPSPPEQQKIAECLSSLDGVIAAEGRKLAALRDHKRGLMQQLFPQPGQTQPRLRFPEFRDKGEWVNKLLDELGERGSGHTPDKKKPEYYNGGIKWVSLADSKRLDQGLISETEIEISEQGLKNSSAVLHPAGTVILSRDAGVGKSAVLAEKMAVSQHFIVWKCNSRQLLNWFLYYLLQKLKSLFEEIATGSTIKTIGLPFFKALRITIPTVEEQHRIADCLTALDTRINAQATKIETLKQHKRGLMQQLFPAPEEV
ncbi:MAG: restriction endonuclease subunit S [Thermodesulfobacteriota bacterium]|nr:restriction endonuclease subunit S [Thermodesulfobacteriota bacterium]